MPFSREVGTCCLEVVITREYGFSCAEGATRALLRPVVDWCAPFVSEFAQPPDGLVATGSYLGGVSVVEGWVPLGCEERILRG